MNVDHFLHQDVMKKNYKKCAAFRISMNLQAHADDPAPSLAVKENCEFIRWGKLFAENYFKTRNLNGANVKRSR